MMGQVPKETEEMASNPQAEGSLSLEESGHLPSSKPGRKEVSVSSDIDAFGSMGKEWKLREYTYGLVHFS